MVVSTELNEFLCIAVVAVFNVDLFLGNSTVRKAKQQTTKNVIQQKPTSSDFSGTINIE